MQYLTPRSVAAALPLPSSALLRVEPRRVLRWVYVARLSAAAAIFAAAVLVWQRAAPMDTLLASLAFAAAAVFTAASAFLTEVHRRPIGDGFLYLQSLFDVLLVTAVVQVTWDGGASPFAPLYVLAIAVAALLLPPKGVTLVAGLTIALYVAEVIGVQRVAVGQEVVLQLAIFATVALGSGVIAARLRAEGTGREALAEELVRFRLRHGDVEQLHLRAERLEAVAELSASLAHEIKNPLASIRSAVEQLAAAPRATDDERTLATLVQRESDRLARLLTGFLDFARVDLPRTRRIDLLEVARNAADLAGTHPARGAGMRITCAFPAGPLLVDADEDMLHRVFFNLILNALQASPPDGEVRLEAATLFPNQLVDHAPAFRSGAVAIRVIDQGPGIPDDLRARLFHPFVTTRPGGSGLGLAIVHRAVEAHHGVIVVDSDARGSRFTVLLPRA